jgi:WD40 repeat protein
VRLGDATLTLSLNWKGVSVASTTHTLKVVAPADEHSLPVSRRLLRSLRHPERKESFWGVRFSEDGRVFGFGIRTGVFLLWDARTGAELRRIEAPPGFVYRGNGDAATTDRLRTLYVPIEGRKYIQHDDPKKSRIEYDGEILAWDLTTGKAQGSIKPAKGRGVMTAYLSPDGGRLFTVERTEYCVGEKEPPELSRLIDPKSARAWTLTEGIGAAAFSADGKRIYLTRQLGDKKLAALEVFDREGKKLATIDTLKGRFFAWPTASSDGKHLAVLAIKGRIDEPASIRLYDLATNALAAEFPSGGRFSMMIPQFSPDGRLLACGDYGGGVQIWDVPARKRIRKQSLKGMQPGTWLAFSPDSRKLAVPARVKSEVVLDDPDPLDLPQPRVLLFDLARGGEPEEIVCPHGWPGGVAFSTDSKVLAVGGAGAVHLFDVAGGASAGAAKPQPSGLPAEARKLRPLAKSELGRAFLKAAEGAGPYAPRTVYRRGKAREWLGADAFARLTAADRVAWTPVSIDEDAYQGLFYGSPLAYLLPLERLGAAHFGGLRGKRVADFGHGGIGQLRLFADLGAEAVGIDVDPLQSVLYAAPGDQGPVGKAGGSVKLVHGRFPADARTVAAVGGGYDLFLSKNTLKRGYIHPEKKVDPRLLVDLGADDPAFLKAVARALKPGGWLVIYNLSPAPNAAGKPYRPMADGRCPFSAEDLAAAGFEVLVRDGVDDKAARALAAALGWDRPPVNMKLEDDLFALVTLARKKPLTGRD